MAAVYDTLVQVMVRASVLNQSFATVQQRIESTFRMALADGAGAGQANKIYADSARSLADGATQNYDLAGVLTDYAGATITFATIKFWGIFQRSTNTTDLTIGDGTAGITAWFGAAADTILCKAGGFICMGAPGAAGYTVTATTADVLKIVNGAGAANVYDLIIVGD